jgi:hypothetical protein
MAPRLEEVRDLARELEREVLRCVPRRFSSDDRIFRDVQPDPEPDTAHVRKTTSGIWKP